MQKTAYVNLPEAAINWLCIESRRLVTVSLPKHKNKMSNLKNTKAMNTVKEAALWTIYLLVMAAAIAGAMLVG